MLQDFRLWAFLGFGGCRASSVSGFWGFCVLGFVVRGYRALRTLEFFGFRVSGVLGFWVSGFRFRVFGRSRF